MKATPKSCSCSQCKRGRATKAGHFFRMKEEHAFRRATKVALLKGREDIPAAPHGSYTD